MERLTDRNIKIWMALMRFGARMGCHQMPERSFFFKGYQFPVCARCTGIFIGELAAVIFLICGVRISFILSLVSVIPLAIDGGLQYINIFKSNNIRRIITGLIAGFGLTYTYFYIAVYLIKIIIGLFSF